MGLARRLEQRAVTFQQFWGSDAEYSPNPDLREGMYYASKRTFAGVNVTQERALRSTVVLACVGLIADSVSSLPWEVYRPTAFGKKSIPLPALLEKPHPDMTRFDWLQRMMTSVLLDGNAFAYILEDANGNVQSLTPLHPYRVSVHRDETKGTVYCMVDSSIRVESPQMLHIHGFIRPGDLRGMSPIEAAKEAVGLALVTEEFGARFFSQGAQSSGVLATPQDLSDNAATVMAKQFSDKHGGVRKAHMPLVLTGGARWTPLSIPPDDAQFLQTRQFQAAEIARLYRVPLHLIQELDKGTSWGTGIEQQNIGFVRYTLMPWLARFEQALSCLLPGKQCVKFNVDEFLRATMFERYQSYALALTNGFLNKDEVRAIEDMPPIEDGSGAVYLQPLNLGPSGDPDKNGDPVGNATKKILSLIGSPAAQPDEKVAPDGPPEQ